MIKKKGLGSWLISLVLIIALVVGWINRNAIYDWWRLRDYNPSARIVELADVTTMTDYTRHMFYVNRPQILDRAEFNQSCPDNGGEHSIVLGCYHGHQRGIFLYSVKEPKLDGVEQVTAAHEALHAVYERLSKKDRQYIDGLLIDFYKNKLKDERVAKTIDSYKKSEPDDVVNEMHSIFATEVKQLTPELEAYFKKYFVNRQKVVALADKYQQTFTEGKLQAESYLRQIKKIEQQLEGLKAQIDQKEADLNAQNAELRSERSTVDSSNAAAFNAKVDAYNVQVQVYKNLIVKHNDLIRQHKALADKYQAIAVETNQLIQELNSRSPSVSAH